MSVKTNLFAAVCAGALIAFTAPAFADFSGILGGNYSNIDVDHGGSVNDWGVNGGGMFGFGPSWAGQIDGGYHHLDGDGGNANDWNVDGSAFWRADAGRIGAVVGYNSIDGGASDENVTNYGVFGDWYATRSITVGLKGGAFSASHDSNGEYVGAALTGYITPDLSLSGMYDYAHFKHVANENDYSLQAEWLISERTPFSVYGGYTHSDFSNGGGSANTWTVGVRFYMDPVDGATLVDRQRNGAEIYGTSFGPTAAHL